MLGRWRTQHSSKHLEEERLNAERERSSSDAASPRSPDAGPPSDAAAAASSRTPDAAPPSSVTSPRSPQGSLHSVYSPEPSSTPTSPAGDQSTPVSLDASTHAQPGTPPPPAGPATADVSPYVTVAMLPAQAHPASDSNPGPVSDPDTVPDSDPVRDAAGSAHTPLAAKDGVAPDSTASGDGVRGTPTSTKEAVEYLERKPYEDISVAEKEVTSSEDDQSKTAKDVPISNDAEIRQIDVKKIPSVEDTLKKAASEKLSDGLESSNTVEDSAGVECEQKSEGASKVDEKSADVIETTKGRGEMSPQSKNSSNGQQSVESGNNESDSHSSRDDRQTSEPCKPYIVHFELGRKIRIQHHAPSQRPVNVSTHGQILETYSRSRSFETVNYLSHTSLGQYAQKAFGAAKANPIIGCAVSLVETGLRLVTAPIVPLIRCWQTPLLCVDRIVYEGFSGVTRAFACEPRTDGVCCGLRDCECSIPIIYTGEYTEIDGKPKED